MIAVLVNFGGDGSKMEGRHIMKVVPFLDVLDSDPTVPMKEQVSRIYLSHCDNVAISKFTNNNQN